MAADHSHYRASQREQARIRDLLDLIPSRGQRALDIGARDSYLAGLLTERFDHVVALDIKRLEVTHPRVEVVLGDVTALAYPDNAFDTVVCAEVLEHLAESTLAVACREIVRVARHAVVIGVPFKQDLRYGRTTCPSCGRSNPPWGHVNAFDEPRLLGLFRDLALVRLSFVGSRRDRTNPFSTSMLRFAGNPFGTYDQEEPCVFCGANLEPPAHRTVLQKFATRAAFTVDRIQRAFTPERAMWMHARFDKLGSKGT